MLVFGRGSDSVGLDPALEGDGESFKVCDNVYENLVTYEAGSTTVVPQLAKSWDVSEDRLTWTFHLRTGVRFHDGTPFDAEAMLFSLARQFDEDHPYHKVQGAYNYWNSMGMSDVVAAMEAADDSTFVVRLAEPNATFLATLGMNFCAAVSPTAVAAHGPEFFKNPVGTGPFKFVEWRKDERIVLDRNDSYWGERPLLKRLIFRPIQDASVRFLELRTGAIQGIDNVSPEFIQAIRENPDLQLLTQPGMNVGYLAMNMDRPPFDNRLVRVAINCAVDKQALVDNFYSGLAVPAKNPLPPLMWGYDDSVEPYPYDPDRARRLLAEAGFPDGFESELWAMPAPRPYMPQPEKIAVAVKANLDAVGVRAKIVRWEWGTYLDKVFAGEHPMCLLGMDRGQRGPRQLPLRSARQDRGGQAGQQRLLLPQRPTARAARRRPPQRRHGRAHLPLQEGATDHPHGCPVGSAGARHPDRGLPVERAGLRAASDRQQVVPPRSPLELSGPRGPFAEAPR